jgi:hypothetical protein
LEAGSEHKSHRYGPAWRVDDWRQDVWSPLLTLPAFPRLASLSDEPPSDAQFRAIQPGRRGHSTHAIRPAPRERDARLFANRARETNTLFDIFKITMLVSTFITSPLLKRVKQAVYGMCPKAERRTSSRPTTFGVITGQANTPRQIEFGLRVHFQIRAFRDPAARSFRPCC